MKRKDSGELKATAATTPRASVGDIGGLHADELSALLAVARCGSFAAAGIALGRDPSVISKRIAALEKRLGVRLLERSTRQLRLTDAGARLAERVQFAKTVIDEAEQEASTGATEVRGNLRLAFPAALGRLWLAPLVPRLLARFPSLQLDIDYSERFVDLIGERFDAAVRVGTLQDSRLVAKQLASNRRILVASPDYIRSYGSPVSPDALQDHNCLEFASLIDYPQWRLCNGDRTQTVSARGNLRTNDSASLLDAALAGVGILGGSEWLVSRQIRLGHLVRVLPDWTLGEEGGIYIVRPSAAFPQARTAAFLDWISETFAHGAPWEQA